LAEEIGWTADGLRVFLEEDVTPPRLVIERLAELLRLQSPPARSSMREATRRSERLKALLNILAEELAWFRDGPTEAREVFRRELDPFDAGYLSSLLNMLFSEDKFHRWLQLTTNRFNYFKTKGSRR
jgi:hypothetical protein